MVITAAHNTRLSRRLLWGLILLYILPGLFARAPWKPDDAAGFGQSHTLSQLPYSEWAISSIGDRLYVEGGLLAAWLSGLLGKIALAVNLPGNWLDDAMRLGNVFWLILAGWAIWNTSYRLAKRVELQPEDPLGAAPTRVDYARSVADASVLCLLGTLGLLVRSHMQVPEVAELAGISLMLLGAVRSLDRPIGAGWMLGAGIAIAFFARGWAHWLPFLLLLLLSSTTHGALRFGLLRRMIRAATVFGALFAAWFIWVMNQPNGEIWWNAWNEWNVRRFLILDPAKSFDLAALVLTLKTLSWFLWPVLPMTCWTIWRYRGALSEPALRIPLAAALGGVVVLVITNPADEANYFPLLAPLSVLAAIGISTMKRGLVSLIDWFAVLWFTFAAVLVWLGWTAATFGFPAKIAANFEKLSPGYVPDVVGLELALALLASFAWVRLIIWRTASGSRALWRPMVLSSGGVILLWLLMMTLWIPRIDYAKSFKTLGEGLTQAVASHQKAAGAECVADYNLGYAQRATLQYHSAVTFVRKGQSREAPECEYLLIQDEARKNLPAKRDFESKATGQWELVWTGRRNSDRREVFFLYARTGQ
jgi:4-amino-4-deoxy-L-arabinose transferase-like glycosyltransferase